MSTGPTITIRGLQSDDWEAFIPLWRNTPALSDTFELPYITEDAGRERFNNVPAAVHTLIAETSLLSGRRQPVGVAWLERLSRRRRHTGILRVLLLPDYRATDVETRLFEAALDLADRWLGLRRVECITFADDTAGVATLASLGFEEEARLRGYALRDGRYDDARLLARVRGIDAHPTPAEPSSAPRRRTTRPLHAQVRGAEADDWEAVALLFADPAVIDSTLQIPYQSRDAIRDRLENQPPDRHTLVAVLDEQVIGLLGLSFHDRRQAHVVSLGMMVRSDYHGRGIGSALMEAALDLTDNWLNCHRIELEVYPDNAPALALYRKFGFEVEGTLRAYAFRAGAYADSYLMARVRDGAAG